MSTARFIATEIQRSSNPFPFEPSGEIRAGPMSGTVDFQGVSMKLLASPHIAPRTAARVSLSLLFAVIASLFAASGCNDYGNTFQTPTGVQTAFIAPSQANAGGAAFTLTVSGTQDSNGNGFVTQSVVQWDGKTIPTTYVSASVLTATVSA